MSNIRMFQMHGSGRWAAVAVLVLMSAVACGDEEPESTDAAPAEESGAAEGPASDAGTEGYPAEWVTVVDESSQVSVLLPETVEPRDVSGEGQDGVMVSGRTYLYEAANGAFGFSVYETAPDTYDLQLGAEGVASAMDGSLDATTPIEIAGHAGVQGEVSFGGESLAMFQIILLDERVAQTLSVGPADHRDDIEADLLRVAESADFG